MPDQLRELALQLIARLREQRSDSYQFEGDGYMLHAELSSMAIREVDTTEYDESNAGEGPD
jgi:hypothetical protein